MATRNTTSLSLGTRYLVLYNTVSTILWLGVLCLTVIYLPVVNIDEIYGIIGPYTKYVQSVAVLEIVHILLGLNRSSLPTTVLQVASRILLVWGVCDMFNAPKESPAYTSMVIAWSLTEVARYTYYVVNLCKKTSPILTWLRYNTFFVLYPLGAGSEAWCIYTALTEAGIWNKNYYWFLVTVLGTYAPGLYNQYTHMIRQRRKQMRGKKVATE